jgi:hypothetical protein
MGSSARSDDEAIPLCHAKAASYSLRQQEVRLVAVITRMRGVSDRSCALADSWPADGLPSPELLAGQINVDSRSESIPHMALDPLAVEIDIRAKDVAAEQVLNDKRGDVALATAWVLGCPSITFLCRVETPGVAYRALEVRKSQHSKTLIRKQPLVCARPYGVPGASLVS